MAAVVIVVVFILLVGAVRAVVIVPNGFAYIIERMGRYRKTLTAGFQMIMPLVDRIAFKHALGTQSEELSEVCETKDQHRASITAAIRFLVLDAQRASYGSADYLKFLRELVRTSQKRYVEGETWDSLRENSRSLEHEVLRSVEAPAEAIGVKVLEYNVRDLKLFEPS